jgi:hypothetical protein
VRCEAACVIGSPSLSSGYDFLGYALRTAHQNTDTYKQTNSKTDEPDRIRSGCGRHFPYPKDVAVVADLINALHDSRPELIDGHSTRPAVELAKCVLFKTANKQTQHSPNYKWFR